jgi:hypothetical protein
MNDVPPAAAPGPDHNLPTARAYLHDMRHAAHLFVTGDHAAEGHLLTVMEYAYRLRSYREESDKQRDEVDGLLGHKKIADTARSSPFTRLLKAGFHKDQLAERNRISRCAAALQHAWNKDTPADDLRSFIAKEGGIVKCGQKVKGAAATKTRPDPVPIPCDLILDLHGHKSVTGTMQKTDTGWQFVPSKVLSPVRQPNRGRARKASRQPEPATA